LQHTRLGGSNPGGKLKIKFKKKAWIEGRQAFTKLSQQGGKQSPMCKRSGGNKSGRR